ncbi:helix-loop-helix DNA-binding domain-containing transcription factor [Mucor lusitanicus]|uniref:Helix-loop-helix DNA-binding domain-containing transcription factor n=1 Tax=Mucor lusitanicus CBS 277.49 TaxID=747725 RepID=A0A168JLT2_MUCCL|nr:helix-loop-helix DNA-binding domain-containing transcription factor [Mucor lusitanicus CBS 277.49]
MSETADANYSQSSKSKSKSKAPGYSMKPSPSSSPTKETKFRPTEALPPPPFPHYPVSSYATAAGTDYPYYASSSSQSTSTSNHHQFPPPIPPPPPPPIDLAAWDQQFSKSQASKRKSPDTAHPYHHPQHSIKHEPSSSSTTSSASPVKERRHRKQPHELLSESQKKANHIASEQKRRQNIRIGFDQLIDIVPSLNHGNRSEALILQKSVDHIRYLISMKNELKNQVRDLQGTLGETNYEEDSSEDELLYF